MYEHHPVPSDEESNEHATPNWVTRSLAGSLPTEGDTFDLDPASGAEDTPHASERYTREDDGLVQPWEGYVWCNPPWSSPSNDGRMKEAWLHKARVESSKDRVDAVFVLLPDDVSTEWFREHCMWGDYITFMGRLKYTSGDRNPAFGSMIIVFGDVPDETVGVLEGMGPTFEGRKLVEKSWQSGAV